jgi:hypothetical protein
MFTVKSIARIFCVLLVTMSLAFSAVGIIPAYAQAAATWYVAITGNDSNTCSDAGSPCLTINGALGKVAAGDTIEVAAGTYIRNTGTEVILVNKDIILSGGWDAGFATQSGDSVIDGQDSWLDIQVTVGVSSTVDKFSVTNSKSSGIDNQGTLIVQRSLIYNNNKPDGTNTSTTDGGGIYNTGVLTIINSAIYSNYATNRGGGGIYNTGSLIVRSSTIANNTAHDGGGIIYTPTGHVPTSPSSPSILLNNVTIAGNTAYYGGGIYRAADIAPVYLQAPVLQNSILATNTVVSFYKNCYGTLTLANNNLFNPNSGCTINGSYINTNPQFGAFSAAAGYFPLLQGSPAIDVGNAASPGSGGTACEALDQLGMTRPLDGNSDANAVCDIGAYEADPATGFTSIISGNAGVSGATLSYTDGTPKTATAAANGNYSFVVPYNWSSTVTPSKTGMNFSPTNRDYSNVLANQTGQNYIITGSWYVATTGLDSNSCTSVDAPCLTINAAIGKSGIGSTIEIATGTYATETVFITNSITLSGGWDASFTTQSGLSTIDGGAVRQGMYSNGTPVVVDHFRIQHGFSNDLGGGIENYGSLTINNSTISDNIAGPSSSCCGGGGGIFSDGTLILNNSTISNNMVTHNAEHSGIDSQGTLTLNNSTVSGNGSGGSVISNFVGSLTLKNSTISNNLSAGFTTDSGHVTLQNTIVAGNTGGSDCYNNYGTVTSLGYNLIGKNTGCLTPTTGDLVGTSQNPINAWLGPLQDNGGLSFTHALLGLSPALNAGNPAAPGSGGSACLTIDQRGADRSAHTPCDIGAYEVDMPIVLSIQRTDPSPTSASIVHFTVIFSAPMTGVDTTAPFSDFALTKTGVTGASISAVSGSGDTYTVAVNTGSSNGTIRLDLVDDDSIQDGSGNPLGGIGSSNGNFTLGQGYTIVNVPTPTLPVGTITDTTPTYTWSKILGATSYQYQLLKGTKTIYTKTVAPGACSPAICANTPTTILVAGSYQWKVRAMVNGVWKNYSPFKVFKVVDVKAGLWTAPGLEFYVSPTSNTVDNFAISVNVYGCGHYKIIYTPLVYIKNKHFVFGGFFYAQGTFGSPTTVSGTLGLTHYYLPHCGYVGGGPFTWTARWGNSRQPVSIDTGGEITLTLLVPESEAPASFHDFKDVSQ